MFVDGKNNYFNEPPNIIPEIWYLNYKYFINIINILLLKNSIIRKHKYNNYD
jgi:hypothetical protein